MTGLDFGLRDFHRVEIVGLSALVTGHFVLLAETPLIGANIGLECDGRWRF